MYGKFYQVRVFGNFTAMKHNMSDFSRTHCNLGVFRESGREFVYNNNTVIVLWRVVEDINDAYKLSGLPIGMMDFDESFHPDSEQTYNFLLSRVRG